MQPYSAPFPTRMDDRRPVSRARGSSRPRDARPANGTYRGDVPASADARRAAFSRFVERTLEHAKAERGWSVPKVAEASGVGDSTLYRWRDGDWKRSPQPEQVVAFCDALGIPPSAAFSILWPGQDDRPAEPEPLPLDPDLQTVLRRLRDPNVPEREKFLIRETLRSLAARSPEQSPKGRRAG